MTTDLLQSPNLVQPESVVMRAYQIMAPAPRRTMSEWADGRIMLSPKITPEPGLLRLSRIPYALEPLDCMVNPRVREVTAMWSAQCAKTTVFIDIPSVYYMHQDPSRIAVYLENEEKQKTWSLTRLTEMVNNTPDLYDLLSHHGGPDSRNSLFYKEFPGGRLSILNSGSEGDLASMSQRIVMKDEIDKWKTLSAGDPDSLADKRAQNSFNKKIINVSTPRDHDPDSKVYSRITVKYEASDMRKYHVPCPFCKHPQILREEQVKFIDRSGDHMADAKY
jgi:phage terminase large subunit GpA-like protein